MLETFVKQWGIFYVIMALCIIGFIGKLYESRLYRRLLRAVENPDRTEHPFVKQLKLKYKNRSQLEHKIHNTDAFIETSLYRYKPGFVRFDQLHTFGSRILLLCVAAGCMGIFLCSHYHLENYRILYHILLGALSAAGLEFWELQLGNESKRKMLIVFLKDYLENVLVNQQMVPVPKIKAKTQTAATKESKVDSREDLKAKEKNRQQKEEEKQAQEKVLAEVIKEFFP